MYKCISFLIVVFNVEKREDPKGTSQTSIKSTEEPIIQQPIVIPTSRRSIGRPPPLEPVVHDNRVYRRSSGSNGDEVAPLISNQNLQRARRSGDVNASASLPEYNRPNDKEYPISTRKKSGPGESGDAGYYVGHSPEHEPARPYVKYFTAVPFLLFESVVAILTRLTFICALIF